MMDYKVTHVKYKFINFRLFLDDFGTDVSGYFLTSVHYINYLLFNLKRVSEKHRIQTKLKCFTSQ